MSHSAHNRAFERIVRPHFDRLYRLAWRLTGGKAEAEDLFQELLLKAYADREGLDAIDEPGSWLCRVMYHLFIDERRRFRRRSLHMVDEAALPGYGVDDIAPDSDPERANERASDLERLDTALARLSDEHRLVILLHDAEGYTMPEIQSLTGVPTGTIKSRLHRARRRLREILAAEGTFS